MTLFQRIVWGILFLLWCVIGIPLIVILLLLTLFYEVKKRIKNYYKFFTYNIMTAGKK